MEVCEKLHYEQTLRHTIMQKESNKFFPRTSSLRCLSFLKFSMERDKTSPQLISIFFAGQVLVLLLEIRMKTKMVNISVTANIFITALDKERKKYDHCMLCKNCLTIRKGTFSLLQAMLWQSLCFCFCWICDMAVGIGVDGMLLGPCCC